MKDKNKMVPTGFFDVVKHTTYDNGLLRWLFRCIFPVTLVLLVSLVALADTLEVSHFTTDGLTGWERKVFKGETEYTVVKDGETSVIKAHSSSAASGYFKKMQLDPLQYRYLHWKWKVMEPLKNTVEKSKAGDDYAARVYVVFPGFFFWQSKAINYVWGSHIKKEEHFLSPFTSSVMVVAVESGMDNAGAWVTEQRDVLADYRKFFGGEPRKIGAVAFMTDTDNTGGSATAWYGEFAISTTRQ